MNVQLFWYKYVSNNRLVLILRWPIEKTNPSPIPSSSTKFGIVASPSHARIAEKGKYV
jgi:hypothetical protein